MKTHDFNFNLNILQIVYCYLCLSFLKSNRAFFINFVPCFEKCLFLKYFKNDFKIF